MRAMLIWFGFANRRLKSFEKDEEARAKSLENESNACAVQDMGTIVDNVFSCLRIVASLVRRPFCKANYLKSLFDDRVDMVHNPRTSGMELVERLYEHRSFLVHIFNLPADTIVPAATREQDPMDTPCEVCKE
ncbi:hypothetical protein CYMTET_14153 [Cymbomonas tetramitiformis]|uniref:Uncharacterized protein n=1 Tax=Cymbomonas tetramitiformis TaxID=36881 RepID=A0AAE0GGV9_9CHLO|nr:hypothetical protein CYMTET_14153 [Cymbomonas tetramitiformis]